MHMRTLVLVCLASALLVPQAEAQGPGENYHVEFGAMFWAPQPGIVILSGSVAPLTDAGVDFVKEFNLENERFTEFRGVLKGGKHKLRISRVPFKYEETATLQQDVVFAGRTFPAGTEVTADLSWDLWRYGYEYDFAKGDGGYIGFLAEVKQNNVTADLRLGSSPRSGASLTDINFAAPQLGIVGRGYPHRNISITAEFTGLKVPGFIRERFTDAEEFEAHFIDFDIYATVSITRFLGIQGGYRMLSVEYTEDAESGDLEMKGPYFGGVLRF